MALTRCTSRLALVHARPLPAVLGLGPDDAEYGDVEPAAAEPGLVAPAKAGVADVGAPGLQDTVAMPALWFEDDADEASGDEPAAAAGVHAATTTPTHDGATSRQVVEEPVGAVPDDDATADEVGAVPADEAAAGEAAAIDGPSIRAPVDVAPIDAPDDRAAVGGAHVDAAAHADVAWVDIAPLNGAHAEVDADGAHADAEVDADGAHADADAEVDGIHDDAEVDADGMHAHVPAEVDAPDDPRAGEASDPVADTVSLLDDLDHDIARAVANAVADKLALLVSPALLPLVADELVRTLDERWAATAATVDGRATGGRGPAPGEAPSEEPADGVSLP